VTVHGSVSLAGAARAIGSSSDDVQRLNPHLRRGRTPPLGPGETWELRLPAGTAAQFVAAYDYRGEKLEPYIVRFGERIEDIGRVRGVAVSRLRSLNGIDDVAEVRAGLTLLVPPTRGSSEPLTSQAPGSLAGDEIVIVAVPDKSFTVPGRKQIFYRTISGDSIWSIARFFKVKDTDLLRWNNLDPEATLATKMVLSLWVEPQLDTSQVVLVDPARVRVVTTGSDEFFELVETLRGRKRLLIKVQTGDTLEKIGKRYGLSVKLLAGEPLDGEPKADSPEKSTSAEGDKAEPFGPPNPATLSKPPKPSTPEKSTENPPNKSPEKSPPSPTESPPTPSLPAADSFPPEEDLP
jgi:LysM repeat protein